jgi:hypothetical protein
VYFNLLKDGVRDELKVERVEAKKFKDPGRKVNIPSSKYVKKE